MKRLCQWILYGLMGWKKDITQEHPDKYIICLAPHTSNWDFIIGQLFAMAEGMHTNFLMKKEWFFWPLGILFRSMGGIPVYRQKSTSMTDTLAETAKSKESFKLCVTPEGTRSATKEWKKGFYYIALKAKMPILLYGMDYGKRMITCTKTIIPSGDIDKDMEEIKRYYTAFEGKHPENFII
ncbi:acyltransferase [Prevotella sp. PINT]|uniref:1-acyl-sn-glycerol-3-phosphate acyltransferase n=1 Tax=Palleniella intestinalis TaxID=2736291 RepID=UPI0015519463|nr:1-acyl-sn-glycerol-3-phosphate acyltransferase [Palleniella intestinalis]NPD81552.1 acyltransferase [Palleniella intestinalis]